jgi:Zn-dependent protease with chaperone function
MPERATVSSRYVLLGLAGLACATGWIVAAIYLWRTAVPALHLSGLDVHRYFSADELARARRYGRGERVLWLLATLAPLVALVVLSRRAPRIVRGLGLGRVNSAIVIGMVVLVTLWFVSLPFSLADLWWQHHWGLGPFDVTAWLTDQWAPLAATAAFATATIAIAVGLAGRLGRNWWLAGAPVFVAIAVLFGFVGGWSGEAGTHAVRSAALRERVARIERVEGVSAPVRVQPVHRWTRQANAFTVGFGPSTRVVLWDTLLDGRFSAGQVDVVVAHELGHVKSRHILKGLAWFALFAFPLAFLVEVATRRRGGIANPAHVPLALLVLSVVALVVAPFVNAVSRRYEAEADWHALRATHDPASAQKLFENFARTSLADPDPPLLDYLWLENHPTLMQRIAMAERFASTRARPSRAGPGSP